MDLNTVILAIILPLVVFIIRRQETHGVKVERMDVKLRYLTREVYRLRDRWHDRNNSALEKRLAKELTDLDV